MHLFPFQKGKIVQSSKGGHQESFSFISLSFSNPKMHPEGFFLKKSVIVLASEKKFTK
jgi:hypothetical protein